MQIASILSLLLTVLITENHALTIHLFIDHPPLTIWEIKQLIQRHRINNRLLPAHPQQVLWLTTDPRRSHSHPPAAWPLRFYNIHYLGYRE